MASDVGVEVISSSSECLDEKEQVFENEHNEQYDTQGAEEGFQRRLSQSYATKFLLGTNQKS